MEQKVTGRCLCGGVHYECAGSPAMAGNCHCRDCQRSSGAAYITALFFPKDAVKIAGDVRYFDVIAESGNQFSRGFCPTCGSNLFGLSSGLKDLIGVRAATLDEPDRFPPTINIYVDSAPGWHRLNDDLPTFARGPSH